MSATAIHEFTARGSARAVSRAIEAWAAERRGVSALVVPWESEPTKLSMSLSEVTGDGWAIEHTNVGTIRLADLGDDRTAVAVLAAADFGASPGDQSGRERLLQVLAAWARQIEHQLDVAAAESRPSR